MALLVDQQFAVDALVTLATEAPDTVCTDGTVSPPVEALGLEGMATGVVQLPPTPRPTPVYGLVLPWTGHAWLLWHTGEHVDDEFRVFVEFIETQRFLQLQLGGHGAGVTFFIDPLHGKKLVVVHGAHVFHLQVKTLVGDGGFKVGDHDVPFVVGFNPDLVGILAGMGHGAVPQRRHHKLSRDWNPSHRGCLPSNPTSKCTTLRTFSVLSSVDG